MATLTASYLVSANAYVNHHGTSRTEAKLSSVFNNHTVTVAHDGLRSLKKLDMFKMQTQRHTSTQIRRSVCHNRSGRIVCGQGMNLVFVGAEVGPWSKTGGLGDVLGGLPPAMAVSAISQSRYSLTSFFLFNCYLTNPLCELM